MKRCLGCMETYEDQYEICPSCGYVEGTKQEESIHMCPGSRLHDRYEIGKVLGYGGFGVTYIAWDERLEQKVAIKEYLPSEFSTRMPGQMEVSVFSGDKNEQFGDGLKKFVEEAKKLAKFQNEPGIVKIFDSFKENETAYIVMEYLDGETLESRLKRDITIPEEEAVALIMPILESLESVHQEGIIHRDISPDNIFITKEGEVKLIDFGASRFATTSHSRSLTVIIKPGFSPEEQYRSRGDQGPHTDVYAMAAVLYKMITGKTPPDAMERRALLETKHKDILVNPRKYTKGISGIVENAILNAMNVRIEDRTPDIHSFISELTADTPVKRKHGKIKKIDLYKWPLWLKIVFPTSLAIILLFAVLLATNVISFRSLFSSIVTIPDKMVIAPDVESLEKDEAIAQLKALNITVSTDGNITSEYVEPGKVVFQSPNAGTYVYEYGTVFLTISSGKQVEEAVNGISTIPYIIWDTLENAIAKLVAAGLAEPEIIEAYDESVEAGKVISQSIEYGSEVEEGTKITIVVSKGPESFTMPNLKNMTENEAISLLEKLGFSKIKVERKNDNNIEYGKIIKQSIVAGNLVTQGKEIILTVSLGKKEDTKQVVENTNTTPENPYTPDNKTDGDNTTPDDEEDNSNPNEDDDNNNKPDEKDDKHKKHNHVFLSEVTEEADCGHSGIRTFYCECGETYTEVIPATGKHNYVSSVTTEPGIDKPGVKTYKCICCGDSYTEEIPALKVSGWVLASEAPTGAQIVETKWKYTKTSYTTSSESSLDGWTLYDTKKEWGSEKTTYDNPTNGERNVWTSSEDYIKDYTHHWVYYHRYGWGTDVKTGAQTNVYGTDSSLPNGTRETIDLTYQLSPQGTLSAIGATYYYYNNSGLWFYDSEYDSPNYGTRTVYHYQDPVYTYYYSKNEELESTEDPSGESDVSEVKKYVKYIL